MRALPHLRRPPPARERRGGCGWRGHNGPRAWRRPDHRRHRRQQARGRRRHAPPQHRHGLPARGPHGADAIPDARRSSTPTSAPASSAAPARASRCRWERSHERRAPHPAPAARRVAERLRRQPRGPARGVFAGDRADPRRVGRADQPRHRDPRHRGSLRVAVAGGARRAARQRPHHRHAGDRRCRGRRGAGLSRHRKRHPHRRSLRAHRLRWPDPGADRHCPRWRAAGRAGAVPCRDAGARRQDRTWQERLDRGLHWPFADRLRPPRLEGAQGRRRLRPVLGRRHHPARGRGHRPPRARVLRAQPRRAAGSK